MVKTTLHFAKYYRKPFSYFKNCWVVIMRKIENENISMDEISIKLVSVNGQILSPSLILLHL